MLHIVEHLCPFGCLPNSDTFVGGGNVQYKEQAKIERILQK
jgi:hypothetical protein